MEPKLNEWIKFNVEYKIPPEVKFINCDTRDFAIYFSTEENSNSSEIIKYTTEQYLVSSEFLLFILNDIFYIKSGGDGEWRHLETKENGWLKYIWFTRFDDNYFIVTTRNGKYISPNKIKDMINWDNDIHL